MLKHTSCPGNNVRALSDVFTQEVVIHFKHFSFGHCHVSLHVEMLRFVRVEHIFAKMHRS